MFQCSLILDHLVKDKLFIERLIWHYKDKKVSDYGCILYEVKDGELVRPIDYYIRNKPLDYKTKFKFTLKKHESKEYKDKTLTEFYYQSCYRDGDMFRI
jgi:hypothetical protein